MKLSIFGVSLIMACILFSCKKSNINYQTDFKRSYSKWQSFKKETNNTYRYQVLRGSWTGFSWQTTIDVRSGKVTRRYFKLTSIRDLENVPAEEQEWTESGDELGTHQNTPAASPVTLDEIYHLAQTDWLSERPDATTYFEAKNNGMISRCGYVVNGCMDDCFVGINITFIEAL